MKQSVFNSVAGVWLVSIVCSFSMAAMQPESRISTEISLQEGETVFTAVDQMPRFPGGEDELMKFINTNIVYPASAKETEIQGRVVVNFIVEKDGTLSNFKVVRSVSEDLDNEAINVLKKMPAWNPGEQSGKKVRVKYTMPIVFRL
ncbi:MAG: energy transducer TonB [Tannerellaceae bacterium]|nr:energy transducer TonB [Tannerellaceae bacterium]